MIFKLGPSTVAPTRDITTTTPSYRTSASQKGPGSFAAGTNQGYNTEDCASQCLDSLDNIDCLAATYTPPPDGGFSIIDGHLEPGTRTFFEFVSEPASASGIVLAIFENSFSG
jgi:hypothetical protein